MPQHDTASLETQLFSLSNSISSLSNSDYPGQLRDTIHKPGWTTVAEGALVANSLEFLKQQVDAIAGHTAALTKAAQLVGPQEPSALAADAVAEIVKQVLRELASERTLTASVSGNCGYLEQRGRLLSEETERFSQLAELVSTKDSDVSAKVREFCQNLLGRGLGRPQRRSPMPSPGCSRLANAAPPDCDRQWFRAAAA